MYPESVVFITSEKNHSYLPARDIDLSLLVFIERYATNFLKWDLLLYFGQHPDQAYSAQEIAAQLGLSYRAIRPELGDLTMLNILQNINSVSQPVYQLTANPVLRNLTIEFARKKPSASYNKTWLYMQQNAA